MQSVNPLRGICVWIVERFSLGTEVRHENRRIETQGLRGQRIAEVCAVQRGTDLTGWCVTGRGEVFLPCCSDFSEQTLPNDLSGAPGSSVQELGLRGPTGRVFDYGEQVELDAPGLVTSAVLEHYHRQQADNVYLIPVSSHQTPGGLEEKGVEVPPNTGRSGIWLAQLPRGE